MRDGFPQRTGRTALSLSFRCAKTSRSPHYRPLTQWGIVPGNDRASSSTVSCSVLASGDRRRAEDPRTLGRQSAEGPSGVAVQEYETSSPRRADSRYRRWCKGDPAAHRRTGGAGARVLMISSEMEELVEGSQRVVVLRDGRSVAELSGEQKNTGNSAPWRKAQIVGSRRWIV